MYHAPSRDTKILFFADNGPGSWKAVELFHLAQSKTCTRLVELRKVVEFFDGDQFDACMRLVQIVS